ncbi:hypothetical protein CDG81_22390 [Actinopolyspora erythraea]|uniref:Uncharacterized protein n=1 Tax=Actinopolyspora erythraea TaxID=414996 RepID=A0A099D9B2_9ACTN|nr:hypothetical protein [Actinopolyspora erythraea]ASU80563.1 hypothetical protein CDG81_22390 [Actinopolyspora erythraea]KGI82758.1 hypothetical protein IL38_02455 [Actinopolyspora erythraea]
MPKPCPTTTILLRECAGTGLATAAFAYSGWITLVLSLSLVTTITHPDEPGIELHAFFGALACLLWWTGTGGLRLAGWPSTWPVTTGLTLTAIHTTELAVMTVAIHHSG